MQRLAIFLLVLISCTTSLFAQAIEWEGVLANFDQDAGNLIYGANEQGQYASVVSDAERSAYVCGYFRDKLTFADQTYEEAGSHVYVAKISSHGKLQWVRTGASDSLRIYRTPSVALDSSGNVIILTPFIGTTTSLGGQVIPGGAQKRWSVALWKFNNNGTLQWGKILATYRDTSGNTNGVAAIFNAEAAPQIDKHNNIYCYLQYNDSASILGQNYIHVKERVSALLKLSDVGSLTWIREMDRLDTVTSTTESVFRGPVSLSVTPLGNAYFSISSAIELHYDGSIIPFTSGSAQYLAKVNPLGSLVWLKKIQSGGFGSEKIRLGCDARENLYFAGMRRNSGFELTQESAGRIGLAKLDSEGNRLWKGEIQRYTRTGAEYDYTNGRQSLALSVSPTGEFSISAYSHQYVVYLTHKLEGNAKDDNDFSNCVLRFTPEGTLRWGDIINGAGQGVVNAVGMRQDGGVYALAQFKNYIIGRDTLRSITQFNDATALLSYGTATLATSSPGRAEYCAGDTMRALYQASTRLHKGNLYKIIMSDTGDVFNDKSKVIGALDGSDSVGVVECVVPYNAIPDKTYRLRIESTSPYIFETGFGPEFTVRGPLPVMIRAKDTLICEGQSTSLSANGAEWYRWSTGDTVTTITVSKAGRYILTGYNHLGCEAHDTVNVKVLPIPVAQVTITGDTTFCDGGQVKLRASTAQGYAWSNRETTQEITVRKSGIYSVILKNAAGCTDESDPIRITVLPTPEKPTITRDSNTLISSADYGNQWYLNGVKLENDTNKTHTVTKTGRYSLRVINDVGCASPATDIDVIVGSSNVNALTAVTEFKINYSPQLQIVYEPSAPTEVQLDIIDVLGRTVSEVYRGIASGAVQFAFPADLPRGTYYVRASHDGKVETAKALIK